MRLSGTFLNSKIAQRIALILFLAAFIPTALITGLTHNTVDKLVTSHSHEKIVNTSKNYALSAFSNLIFARTSLYTISSVTDSSDTVFLKMPVIENHEMFKSLLLLASDGQILGQSGDIQHFAQAQYKKEITAAIKEAKPNKAKLLVLPPNTSAGAPIISLILPRVKGASKTLLIAEINPSYIWGDVADYPSDISICAYRIEGDSKSQLFCSSEENPKFKGNTQPENAGDWELFIRGELQDNNWSFVTKRLYPVLSSPLGDFLSSYGYIGAAVFSLLLVALLSLVQIRRTMVPLERLIAGCQDASHDNAMAG